MRRLTYPLFCVCLLAFFACKNKSSKPKEEIPAQPFFPVADFINGQVQEVKKQNLKVVRFATTKGVTTSKPADLSGFEKDAAQFTSPDFTQAPLKNKYRESSFADQSVPNITLTYSTTDRTLEIQRVDIILEPDPEANDKVKTIYMEKQQGKRLLKMLWTSDSQFQIISNDSGTTIVKYVWNIDR